MKQELHRINTAIRQIDPEYQGKPAGVASGRSTGISFTIAPPSEQSAQSNPSNPSAQSVSPQSDTGSHSLSHLHLPDFLPLQALLPPPSHQAESSTVSVQKTVPPPTKPAQPPDQQIPGQRSPQPAASSPPQTEPDLLRTFPRQKLPEFSQSRQVTNPEFVKGLLRHMDRIVTDWQRELQQVNLKIQDLYLEGPVIDGWLESQPQKPDASSTATIRHADIDRLVDYVTEICQQAEQQPGEPPKTHYRLCGLNADGHLWSRPCPVDKVPQVGVAIARYQRLRQLLGQKQTLENQLDQFAQALIQLHGTLPDSSGLSANSGEGSPKFH